MRFWLSIAHFKGNYSVIIPPSVQIIIRKLCILLYMPIIDINKPKGQALFAEYVDRGEGLSGQDQRHALKDMGIGIMQTDRPEMLINYLRSVGSHD